MHVRGANLALSAIAEGLLGAKILRPSDWQGELELSVRSGLLRWLHGELRCDDAELNLSLSFTDDVAAAVNWGGCDLPPLTEAEGPIGAFLHAPDVLITCVDTAKSRRGIHHGITDHTRGANGTPIYWLDLGNRSRDGQVILGEPWDRTNGPHRDGRLPTVVEVFPELLDTRLKEDNRPSCSLAEALESQDLFINDHLSRWALQILWDLFLHAKIGYHGVFINLADDPPVRRLPVPKPTPKPAPRRRRTR